MKMNLDKIIKICNRLNKINKAKMIKQNDGQHFACVRREFSRGEGKVKATFGGKVGCCGGSIGSSSLQGLCSVGGGGA